MYLRNHFAFYSIYFYSSSIVFLGIFQYKKSRTHIRPWKNVKKKIFLMWTYVFLVASGEQKKSFWSAKRERIYFHKCLLLFLLLVYIKTSFTEDYLISINSWWWPWYFPFLKRCMVSSSYDVLLSFKRWLLFCQ
jgi:hypothetical protein